MPFLNEVPFHVHHPVLSPSSALISNHTDFVASCGFTQAEHSVSLPTTAQTRTGSAKVSVFTPPTNTLGWLASTVKLPLVLPLCVWSSHVVLVCVVGLLATHRTCVNP